MDYYEEFKRVYLANQPTLPRCPLCGSRLSPMIGLVDGEEMVRVRRNCCGKEDLCMVHSPFDLKQPSWEE